MQIEMTRDAFKAMTPEQKEAILRLTEKDEAAIEVTRGHPLGLPADYLAFVLRYPSHGSMNGGIAGNGDVST